MLVNEIRINQDFTQLTESVYEKTLKGKSTPRVRKYHTGTPAYLKKISSRFNKEDMLMPPNCRYVERLERGGHLVVVEQPPALRTIRTDWGVRGEIERLEKDGKLKEWGINKNMYVGYDVKYPLSFTFAFPYVIFLKAFDENNNLMVGQVFVRVARLTGLADYVLKMPLMNISEDQNICYGDKGVNTRSLDTALSDSIMNFWSSTFNGDYTYNYSSYKDVPYVNSHIEWQHHSQTDPMFIYGVDWINLPYNLSGAIDKMKERHGLIGSCNLGYSELSKIFVHPLDTGKKAKVEGIRKTIHKSLFYDVAQGMYLYNNFFVHVGDPFTLKNGKKAHVDSFIGFAGTDRINYIQLQTETGSKILLKHIPRSSQEEYITNIFKKERYADKGKFANGVEIKEGDIVIIDTPELPSGSSRKLYKHVHYIRKSRDGITEAKLGNAFYILENVKGTVLDIEEPIWDGIKLNKGEEYILLTAPAKVARHRGYRVKFDGLSVDINGNLAFAFQDIHKQTNPFQVKYDATGGSLSTMYKLFEIDAIKQMPPIFRIGRNIVAISPEGDASAYENNDLAWGTPEGVINDYNARVRRVTIDQVVKHCLLDDGTRFCIESYDMDVEFTIGDKVVAADWENPVNTLIVKTIQGFKIDKNLSTVDFILADKNNNLTTVPYVDTKETACVFVGRIRKIANKFGRISAGTKIIASESYIPNFPKKDINIIIGFITDTGGLDPLVLCSNGCTLWYSSMIESFKKITMKSQQWKKLSHAPIDVQKIKFQPGDLIMSRNDYKTRSGWLVWSNGTGMHKMSNLSTLHKYSDHYHLDGYIKSQSFLDCIPNPRMQAKAVSEVGIERCWPNFHGLFVTSNYSDFSFIKDERSIIHVQDSRE